MTSPTEKHMGIEADEEEASFASGFSDTTTEPAPAPEPTPAVVQLEQPEPQSDPFAGLPQQVRDLLANIPALEQRVQAAETNFRAAQGRVASLQSRFDKLMQPNTNLLRELEEAPRAQAARFKAVEAIRQELPEIAAAFDELSQHQQPAPAPEPTPAVVQPEQPEPQSDPQIEALDQLRPTWAADTQSSDFQLWLAQQPANYRTALVNSDKAKDILAALGQFDTYRAQLKTAQQTNTTRTARMASAVTPQGDGRKPPRVQIEDDEDAAFRAGFNGR